MPADHQAENELIKDLKMKLEGSQVSNASLEAQLKESKKHVDSLQKELSEKTTLCIKLEGDAAIEKRQAKDFEQQNKKLQKDLSELQALMKELETTADTKGKEVSSLSSKLHIVELELEETFSKYRHCELTQFEEKQKMSDTLAENGRLNMELKIMNTRTQTLEKMIFDLQHYPGSDLTITKRAYSSHNYHSPYSGSPMRGEYAVRPLAEVTTPVRVGDDGTKELRRLWLHGRS
jgi:chromosome segregation ATPase